MRRSLSVATLILSIVSILFAKGSTTASATANFLTPTYETAVPAALVPAGFGVTGDGGPYQNNVGGVQSYWGSAGKNYSLVTYATSRYLTISFLGSESQAWYSNAHLSQTNSYQVDLYGINFYGAYASMAPGTTAQVHGVLQFHYLGNTYQLDYASLAVMRDASNGTYHFTSDPNYLPGYPGFWPSPAAMLSLVRSKGNVNYGTVTVPIRFDVQ